MVLLRKDIFLDSSMVEHSAVNRVVVGSSPTRGVFLRPHGQAVKTSPFHGGNTGSIPVGVIWRRSQVVRQWSATPVSTGSNPVDASSFPETDSFWDFSFLKISFFFNFLFLSHSLRTHTPFFPHTKSCTIRSLFRAFPLLPLSSELR